MRKIAWFLLAFNLFSIFSIGQNDSISHLDSLSVNLQKNKTFHIPLINSEAPVELDSLWKYSNGDNMLWASPAFDDSGWKTESSDLKFNKDGTTKFKGIGWFRIHIFIDSAEKENALCLLIKQYGASEIYIDGKLIHSLGTVSADTKKEIKNDPNETPLSFQYKNAGEHVIAVRYSNLNFQKLYNNYNADIPGFSISIAKLDTAVQAKFSQKILTAYLLTFISVFFLTLTFVHLLLFLFYRKQRTNLYYTVFVLLMGILFFIPILNENSSNPDLSTKFDYYYPYLLILFFYSMLVMEDYLFRRTIGRSLLFSTAITIAIALGMAFLLGKEHFKFTFIISFIIGTIYSSFSIVIKAIIQKLNGAWIIGTGSLFFLIFLSINILFIMLHNGTSYRFSFNGWEGLLLLFTTLLAIMSIPISMSVYLAREFAQTNKHLEKELKQVEALSQKTIEQEKEKQKILETQKEMLEVQVKERTYEIVEQKKLIEEKNKDITDSINYAKRIQEAILPEHTLLSNLFKDSFVLFKPKDIVSGDFYWFAEHLGKKIIAVADCTGHGVPGALMSMIGSNILNKLIIENGITEPDQILNMLNDEIRTALKQKENTSETRDGMDISLISIYGDVLEYAGAQRPLWIINSNGLQEIKADKFAIGGIQQEQKRIFTKHTLTLQKNDVLYLSSDGFADQFGGESGKKLMTRNFKELLLGIQNQPMEQQKDLLKTTIENWKGNREQVDDILVIGVKI